MAFVDSSRAAANMFSSNCLVSSAVIKTTPVMPLSPPILSVTSTASLSLIPLGPNCSYVRLGEIVSDCSCSVTNCTLLHHFLRYLCVLVIPYVFGASIYCSSNRNSLVVVIGAP